MLTKLWPIVRGESNPDDQCPVDFDKWKFSVVTENRAVYYWPHHYILDDNQSTIHCLQHSGVFDPLEDQIMAADCVLRFGQCYDDLPHRRTILHKQP